MAAKTLAAYIAEMSAVSSLGAGDKVPLLEAGSMVYVDGASIGGGGGITALTGDVTASGSGSVAATIANGAVDDIMIAAGVDAAKLADGTVSNAEFQYLNGVTSAIQTQLDAKVDENVAIVAGTKTKITYDTKGLVTAGADATTADIAASTDKNYITDAQAVILGNTSGTNTGDVTLAGTPDYITIVGQTITRNAVDLAADVAGTLPIGNGGTGLASLGTTLQQLRVNAGATALEYFTPAASSGDIANGGNTTGAAVTIGTNDDFGLNLETSGVTRMAITGGTGVGGQVTITNVTANTLSESDALTIRTNSTGTASTNFGSGILFQGESSTTDNRDMARISAIWATATDASRRSQVDFDLVDAAGSLTTQFRMNPNSGLTIYNNAGTEGTTHQNTGISAGAAYTIGTNGAFALNFSTNNVTRMAITGGASTGGAVTITNVTANTATVADGLTIQTNSTGTAAASFGGGILFQGESSTTDNQDMVRLSAIWTTATHASRASALVYSDVTAGGAITERFRFTPTGITTAGYFILGNSAQTVLIGGSSGTVGLSTSSATAASIDITNSANLAVSTGGIIFGNIGSFTQTSGTRNYLRHATGFAPTSGTAVHNQFIFDGTFNQTGGANGITRGIYLKQTLTAVADFRGLEIAYSSASAKGIYQTGALTTNNFVGGTMFGSTSAVSAVAAIEVSSTTKGILLPRMTTAERDAISAVAGLLIYNTTTGKLNIYTTAWEAVTSA